MNQGTANYKSDWRWVVWRQFGASMEMLENDIQACPDHVWGDRLGSHEFWYLVYHTLFFLDYYFAAQGKDFRPAAPFTLSELDPAGVLPDRVYSKAELLAYLEHGRTQCRQALSRMLEADCLAPCTLTTRGWSNLEWLLYNARHVQHHVAQLQLLLRQKTDSAPRWVSTAKLVFDAD